MYQRMIRYLMELNPDHEVHVFATGQECLQQLNLKPDLITLDYSLPDMTGEEVLKKIKTFDQRIGVLILSGQQDISTAVKLLKQGAYDYITKDSETKDRLLNALDHFKHRHELEQEVDQLKEQLEIKYEFGNIIGDSQPMQRVFRLLEKAVRSNITVAINGETGTGKEVVAKAIHYNSGQAKGPFVAVNMGAIPSELLESELFGHEKGAFTGAINRKKGHFELSIGGTLFLDEIAEIDLSLQAKLLRALQEREIMRVGGLQPIPFDSRIIIATHKDLAEEVRAGRFREDLYYRLLGLNVNLPPLRERGNDILLMANVFLNDFCKESKIKQLVFSKEAKNTLLGYSYPGNVRELKATIELAAVMADDGKIMPEDIQFQSVRKEANFLGEEMTLEAYKRTIIHFFLNKYDQDVLLVARKLDVGKSTIYRMLKEEEGALS
jgi:two-component system, NtrC family, response regulator AtoC